MATKNPISFRLSDEAMAALKRLEERKGIGRSAILEILIREADEKSAKKSKKDG